MLSNYVTILLKTIFSLPVSALIHGQNNSSILVLRPSILSQLLAAFNFLKLSSVTRLNTLVELTSYDIPSNSRRFTLNYFLLSVEYNYRLALNINIFQNDFVPSLFSLYPNSNWSEREVRDMFGIYFINNPDLRRLLTDYGFEGFPLRKDFPLTGYFEVRYDDGLQQILYEPVQLSQEFRLFSLSSP